MHMRAALLVADYNKEIAQLQLDAILAEAETTGVSFVEQHNCQGAYELPLLAESLLISKRESLELLVVLGYIEKGETLHGEVMGHITHNKLVDLSLKYQIPIGLGIIGPGATLEQARVRAEGSGQNAVRAALRNWKTIQSMSS